MGKIILVIFGIMLSPCLLALLPDRQTDRRKQKPEMQPEPLEEKTEEYPIQTAREAEQTAKLEFLISQAEADIAAGKARLGQLFGLLDLAENNRAGAMPGSRQDISAAKQIISIENQIGSTERRIAKAEFTLAQCKAKLAA